VDLCSGGIEDIVLGVQEWIDEGKGAKNKQNPDL